MSLVAAGLGHDLAHAVRLAAKRPGFSLAVALTLAFGIGANTAVFSIINSVLLRPLPYPESERLYTLFEQDSLGTARQVASYPTFLDWRERTEAFEGLAFVRGTGLSYGTDAQAGLLLAGFVSEDFFPTLRVGALLGRALQAQDYRAGEDNVVVLSHRTWQNAFGGDSGMIGRSIRLGNAPFTIIGVMPEAFSYPNWGAADTDVWLPMTALPPPDMAALRQRDFHADSRVLGRLAPDVTLETAPSAKWTRLPADWPRRIPR